MAIGQGEEVWDEILQDASRNSLKKFYRADNNTTPLTDSALSALPAYHLLNVDRYNRIPVQTQRGCPHRCEFCASSILISNRYQQKPVHAVLNEIDAIQQIWPEPFIEFADDNSFIHMDWWRRFLPELARRNIKWFTETDISIAQHPDILCLMKDAGCRQVLIGLESPRADDLHGIESRADWKQKQVTQYHEAITTIQQHGITVNGCFVLGLDHHDETCFDQVLQFVRQSGLFEVQITLMTPFPGTPLYQRLYKAGRILEPGNWDLCTLFDINYQPAQMSVDALRDGFHNLMQTLYSKSETEDRQRKFFDSLRQNTGRLPPIA